MTDAELIQLSGGEGVIQRFGAMRHLVVPMQKYADVCRAIETARKTDRSLMMTEVRWTIPKYKDLKKKDEQK